MPFELDHVLICLSQGAPEAKYLTRFGLIEGTANVHPGQGTANRRFFFKNAMLEHTFANNKELFVETNKKITDMALLDKSIVKSSIMYTLLKRLDLTTGFFPNAKVVKREIIEGIFKDFPYSDIEIRSIFNLRNRQDECTKKRETDIKDKLDQKNC